MRVASVGVLVLAAIGITVGWTREAGAQNACLRYVNACGNAPGYFRPQGWTLNQNFVPQPAPSGSYYAPVGPNGAYWRQWNSRTGLGPVEPNPYSNNGRLMNPYRIGKHVYTTRIVPRIQRRYR